MHIIINPFSCVVAITRIQSTISELEYDKFKDDKPVTDVNQRFFQARAGIISWIIYSDGIGFTDIPGNTELIPSLEFVQELFHDLFDENIQLFTFDPSVKVA